MTLSPWPSSLEYQDCRCTPPCLVYPVLCIDRAQGLLHMRQALYRLTHIPSVFRLYCRSCATEANIGLLYEPCLWGENAIPAHMFHPDFSSPGTIAGRLLVFASRSPNKKHVLFLCGLSPLGKLFYWFSQLEKEALMFVSVSLLQPCVLLTCLFPKELYFIWGSICISYVDLYFI